jgi:hypothetical protein
VKSQLIMRDGRRVNLASAISPELYGELEGTQGRGTRQQPLLSCGACGGGIYIRHGSIRRDELFGTHFDTENCTANLTIRKSTMSDKHKRMAEYHAAAAQAEGLEADLEVTTSTRTRVDVVVDGRVGIEVQRSALSAGAAVRRTVRSMSAGLETVAWCAELGPTAWNGKVPGYQWLDNGQVLREMPRPHTVRSRGVITFRAERSWQGGWEPQPEPLTVLVDEAVVRMASGSIRPMIVGKLVQLVRSDGIALYEEITGIRLTPFAIGSAALRALSPAPEAKCYRPPARTPAPRACEGDPYCEESPRPYEDGQIWLCPGHARHRYVIQRVRPGGTRTSG